LAYTALYRKFRPVNFDDVRGQDHIVTTLKNQVKDDKIAHAYLFCGTRGTGKTSVAKIMARAVNCENPKDGSPCGECEMCKSILSGSSLNVIEMDAASNNGVDNIREIVEEVTYSPASGKYKVYIIDEVHMLSTGAYNALLKTLEEPPGYVIFILATTEVQKIPVTILSRCQRYDFHRIGVETIEDGIKNILDAENISIDERALRYIAKSGEGSMRDSLSILDRCLAFNTGGELTYDNVINVLGVVDIDIYSRLFNELKNKSLNPALNILSEVVNSGRELNRFISDYVWFLRNLMLIKSAGGEKEIGELEELIDISIENLNEMASLTKDMDLNSILRDISFFSELLSELRLSTQKRILIEMAFIKICNPVMRDDIDGIDKINERIDAIEKNETKLMDKIKSGNFVSTNLNSDPGDLPGDNLESGSDNKQTINPENVPMDIRELVSNWGSVVTNASSTFMKTTLSNAKLSIDFNDVLEIVPADEMSADMISKEDKKSEIAALLKDCAGKDIDFRIVAVKSKDEFENTYIDLKGINFEIETEE